MKITFISDTHCQQRSPLLTEWMEYCNADVLVHCGDFSRLSKYSGWAMEQLQSFLGWFGEQPHPKKIFIGGNHDFGLLDSDVEKVLKNYPDIIYLENSSVVIEGVVFWGCPTTTRISNLPFSTYHDSKELWENIPDNVNVLITHSPARGVLDLMYTGENVGSVELRKKINTLSELKVHAFGHIHEASGIINESFISINASVLDGQFIMKNKPVTVEI